ncbi:hypothetical protein [Streptomyces rubradiris]|uniref:hypothetical protein n=1 Tax=Streptomyces rubradiris TaxID=285531 RepID=UPI001994A282|nr:hypothetical protein [Streptomyces rubradiris]GHH25616.1 hypothetical protein GCM10018792_64810 [Streptomyces rubradiris]
MAPPLRPLETRTDQEERIRPRQMIETRVCIDDTLGPFDCKLDPANRWNGWLSPHFPLDTARQLSAQTLQLAEEYGYDHVDTIHVIEGRADSRDTVHIIEGGPFRHRKNDKPQAVAVRINWRNVDRDAAHAARITEATPQARKAARRCRPGGRGASRAVIVHVRWQFLDEGSDTAANVVTPDSDGLFPIGGWEWTWHSVSWWCLCGADHEWHIPRCHLTREQVQAFTEAVPQVGAILRRLAPGATAALLETVAAPRIVGVVEGATELNLGDGGPFDTETLGEADAVLRAALGTDPIQGGPHWIRFPPNP